MIIQCVNCNKKFEVKSSLIPDIGREIQCGSCNHIWFYTPNLEASSEVLPNQNIKKQDQLTQVIQKKELFTKAQTQDEYGSEDNFKGNEIISKVEKTKKTKKIKNANSFKFINILFYFIVSIISFIAIIIVLDTFKSPLGVFFPNIELILYNLFETIKDIYLFIKNLLV